MMRQGVTTEHRPYRAGPPVSEIVQIYGALLDVRAERLELVNGSYCHIQATPYGSVGASHGQEYEVASRRSTQHIPCGEARTADQDRKVLALRRG